MQFFPMNYLMNLHNLPALDWKIAGYGVLWALAIAAGFTWIIA